jgi:small subunit ribosomal protein S16
MDARTPRNGRVLEELGTYDPFVPETDARAILNRERVDYWLGVGAKPTDKVGVLIKKYGTDGTHLEAQRHALERLAQPTPIPDPGEPASKPKKKKEKKEAPKPAAEPAAETEAAEDKAADEQPAAEEKPEEQPAEETS